MPEICFSEEASEDDFSANAYPISFSVRPQLVPLLLSCHTLPFAGLSNSSGTSPPSALICAAAAAASSILSLIAFLSGAITVWTVTTSSGICYTREFVIQLLTQARCIFCVIAGIFKGKFFFVFLPIFRVVIKTHKDIGAEAEGRERLFRRISK